MTGRSLDAGQTGRPAAWGTTATAVLAAGSMLVALGLSACSPSTASARTVLRSARAATLELAGGGTRAATVGMTVPKGATVRTEPGGSASLVAAGRTVLLGSATSVTVLDGARERLRRGLVMVDARHAPGLSLDAGAATVQTPPGGLARIERGVLLRAASFARTLTVRAAGRRGSAPVGRLHQVQVPDGGVPGRVTPLALTRDSWERRYALDLVTADADLVALADGLDRNPASAASVLQVLPASFATAAPVTGQPRSEAALALVVAKAAGRGDLYGKVRDLRADGGSWGVVAALVGAEVAKVSAALDSILNPAAQPPALALGTGGGTPTGGTGGGTGGPSVQPSPRPGGGATGRPSPRPSPSPSSDPVQDVVTTVTGLLPTPTPTPVTVGQLLPSPSASPLVSVHLGGVTVGVG
ncbi:MAG: hypothetical protein JWP11_398 [Frankiales bacterium]|nr:hypothetical protein [Frankiales bacterium]